MNDMYNRLNDIEHQLRELLCLVVAAKAAALQDTGSGPGFDDGSDPGPAPDGGGVAGGA